MRQQAGEDKVQVQVQEITELPRLPPEQEGRAAAANSTTLQVGGRGRRHQVIGAAGKHRGSRFMWGSAGSRGLCRARGRGRAGVRGARGAGKGTWPATTSAHRAPTAALSLSGRGIALEYRLVKAMVFPVVTYGCESWTIKRAERRRIDAFELWCWRRLLRVPWTARRSNLSILREISPGCSLGGLMLKLKLKVFWPPDAKS